MRRLRPKGEKLPYRELQERAETYQQLADSLFSMESQFALRQLIRFEKLAAQYQKRLDNFVVVQPRLAPKIRL